MSELTMQRTIDNSLELIFLKYIGVGVIWEELLTTSKLLCYTGENTAYYHRSEFANNVKPEETGHDHSLNSIILHSSLYEQLSLPS